MPEGDTVWLTAHRLQRALAGREVTHFDLRVPGAALVDLRGATVTEVVARGKHILMRFADGHSLHSHLRMDGSWRIQRSGRAPSGFAVRAVVGNAEWLAAGHRVHDLTVLATADEDRLVGHLGPDLLGPDWDPGEAERRLRDQPDRPVAEALLDQRTVAGIGNMYVAEILFVNGVDPYTAVGAIAQPAELLATAYRLVRANRDHPEQSTTGSTVRGEQHWVYNRAGQPCRRCRTPVRRAPIGVPPAQRTTYWCSRCQPPPRVAGC